MATKNKTREKEESGTTSLTGTTPKVADLKVGLKLYREHKGKRYDFEIVEVAGKRLIRMRGGKGTWASLSSAAQSVSGHAERGATVMRDAATGKTLLPVPRYDRMAATPAPKAKKAPAKKTARKTAKPSRARQPVKMVEGVLADVLLPTHSQMRAKTEAAVKRARKSDAQRARRAARKAAK